MKTEEIKGQLLTRQANLMAHGKTVFANILQLEKQLVELRAEADRTQGACQEIDKTIAILDQPSPLSAPPKSLATAPAGS